MLNMLKSIAARLVVSDWKESWRWLSMHAMAFGASLEMTWAVYHDTLRTYVSDETAHFIGGLVFIVGIVARLKNQVAKGPTAGP